MDFYKLILGSLGGGGGRMSISLRICFSSVRRINACFFIFWWVLFSIVLKFFLLC